MWKQSIALGPILVVYFCLSLFRLDHQSLWLDEVLSIQNSSVGSSISDPVLWLRGQGPFFFVLLHFWQKLAGVDEFSLRLLSVLLGSIAICLTFQLGLILFNRRIALVASALMATSPFFIWYSQEVRYVTLMMAASLLTMYFFWQAISSDRFLLWVGYGSAMILAVAAFVSNLFLLALHGGYLLCSHSRSVLLKKWMISLVMFFVLSLWWANDGQVSTLDGYGRKIVTELTAWNGKKSVDPTETLSSGGSKKFDLAMMPYTFFAFNAGFSLGPSLRELHQSRSAATLVAYAPILVPLGLFFGILLFYGLVVSWRQPQAGRFLMLWIAIPMLGVLGVAALSKMSYNVRYVAMAFPAYLFILASAIEACRKPAVRISILAGIISLNSISLANYYFNPNYSREDTRAAVRHIESRAGLRDAIVVAGNSTTLRYYYKGRLPIVVLERSDNRDPMTLSRRLGEIGKDREHLWLVIIRQWEIDPSGKLALALKYLHPQCPPEQFPGVDVYALAGPERIL